MNKIATLRNARGHDLPHLETVARDIVGFGAGGITVHPRPDERHIRYEDVYVLSKMLHTINLQNHGHSLVEYNIEGYPSPKFMQLMAEVKPTQCTLVPDPPDAITSNAGWNVKKDRDMLTEVISELSKNGIRSSLFVDPNDIDTQQVEALLQVKPDRVELYTEAYANAFGTESEESVTELYNRVAIELYDLGIGINAGHDLNLQNVGPLVKTIPVIDEVSIGHALISEALYLGLEETIKRYLQRLGPSTPST
ncbi:MAG: pyridoxine 5'-phosphate synthase [Bdellovibrionales bacterium]|nr:pyridoxine 5'-phosphate synthase [Bdellovibrionales bacterium]